MITVCWSRHQLQTFRFIFSGTKCPARYIIKDNKKFKPFKKIYAVCMQLISRSSKQETMEVLPSCWIKEMSRGHVSTNQAFFASRGPWAPIARNKARDHFPRVRALTTCWTNADCKTAVRFVYVSRKLSESVTSLTTAEKTEVKRKAS